MGISQGFHRRLLCPVSVLQVQLNFFMTDEFYLLSSVLRYLNINVWIPKVIFDLHGSTNHMDKVTVYSKFLILILYLKFVSEATNAGPCMLCLLFHG